MKNYLPKIFLGALLLGWTVPFSVFTFPKHNTTIPASITIPKVSLDLSDLDVRDGQNRKIQSASARLELESLFVSGLNRLLTFNLTPTFQFMREMMSQSWQVFSCWLTHAARRASESMDLWWQGRQSNLKKIYVRVQNSVSPAAIQFSKVDWLRPGFIFLHSSIISSTVILR